MARTWSLPVAGVMLLAAACGTAERAEIEGSVVLECGDERPPAEVAASASPIVNGSAEWDPTVVAITRDQALAIGAIMSPYYGSEWTNICTGTLIAPDLVLTAAHCVAGRRGQTAAPSQIRFAVGVDSADPVKSFDIAEVHMNPDYDRWGGTAKDDVAVLVLAPGTSAQVEGLVPIPIRCDALEEEHAVGALVQTVGYGTVDSAGRIENTRRWWAVEELVDVSAYDFVVDGHGEAGVCFGDSGGPTLWTTPEGDVRVIGTLSWGDPDCGNQDHFARADANCDFLRGFLQSCGEVSEAGQCQDGRLVRCDQGVLVEDDCGARGLLCEPGAEAAGCVDPCGGETLEGRCDGDEAIWCEGGVVRRRQCDACGQTCGWSEARQATYCL